MLPDVAALLACPVCTGALDAAGRTLRCARGHAFDVARQGYVNLLTRRSRSPGDTASMVAARDRFLRGGWYAPIADAIADAVAEAAADGVPGAVLDVGAGTGWYLARVLDAAAEGAVGLALDVSPFASRRAARCHPRAGAVVADTWGRLPVRDGVAGVVLDVFAPRNAAEIARVLPPGGSLVVVTPAPEHLAELRAALGLLGVQPDKEERVAASLGERFTPVGERRVRARLHLPPDAVADLVAMGPSAWHGARGEVDGPVDVTASVRVARYVSR
ncbi:MAG: putative RNA methyltransferase [Actinomycetota bacterium]